MKTVLFFLIGLLLTGCSLSSSNDIDCIAIDAYSVELWAIDTETGESFIVYQQWPALADPADWRLTGVFNSEERTYVALGDGHGVVFNFENRDALIPIGANGFPADISFNQTRLAYMLNDPNPQVWVSTTEGSNPKRMLEGFDNASSENPVWLNDNRRIFFQGEIDGVSGSFLFDIQDDELELVSEFRPSYRASDITADGSHAVFINELSDNFSPLYIKNLETGEQQQINQAQKPVFISGDGSNVIYMNGTTLMSYDTDTQMNKMVKNGITNTESIGLSEDGNEVLYATGEGLFKYDFASESEELLISNETLNRVEESWDIIESNVVTPVFPRLGGRAFFLISRFNSRTCETT